MIGELAVPCQCGPDVQQKGGGVDRDSVIGWPLLNLRYNLRVVLGLGFSRLLLTPGCS